MSERFGNAKCLRHGGRKGVFAHRHYVGDIRHPALLLRIPATQRAHVSIQVPAAGEGAWKC